MRAFSSLLLTSVLLLSPAQAPRPAEAAVVTHDAPTAPRRNTLKAEMAGADAATMAELARSYGPWGFDIHGMDRSVRPGDDFFTYANGRAVAETEIPGDQPSYGSFDKLTELSELQLKTLVTGLAAKKGLTGDDRKIADLYASMMDTKTRDRLDMAPLKPELDRLIAVRDRSELARFMGWTSNGFGSALFGLSVGDDAGKPGYWALQLSQAGLGLPDRDYYLSNAYADKTAAYQAYITDLLKMAGYPHADANARAIVAFETEIAKVSWTRIEDRDDTRTYNPMALAALPAFAPGFDWAAFFDGAGVSRAQKVIVAENTAFPKIATIFADTPLDTLKAWEAFNIIDQASPYLSQRIYDRRFGFQSRALFGIEEQRPLWKRAVALTDDKLGDALGRAYVRDYFPADSKARMTSLVHDLLAAMKARIETLSWMSAATKARALEKLSTFGVKIGYPSRWRDYSKLVIRPDDLYGNVERASAFDWAYQVSHIDRPIDPDDWSMTPQTVDAYYSPTRNEIVFPAAILQPPFFDPKADTAVNYGGIGAVIGHEITHGFDDQGRHHDATGALGEWWTPEDAARFEARTRALGAQYDAFEPLPGVHIQGDLTMGENIADLGGLLVALDAYHLSLHGKAAPVLDGFTGDQRLFLAFAQIWRTRYRPDYLKSLVVSDEHSPDTFRSIGATRNVDAWYKAFDVTDGRYFVKPEDRVRIW
jgi:putative endopeptidase